MRRVIVRSFGDFVGYHPTAIDEFEDDVTASCVSRLGDLVAVGLASGTIEIRLVTTGARVSTQQAHPENVIAMAFQRAGGRDRIISVARDGSIAVLQSSEAGWTLHHQHQLGVDVGVAGLSHQGDFLAITHDNVTWAWETDSWRKLIEAKLPEGLEVEDRSVAISGDGKYLAAGFQSANQCGFVVWQTDTQQPVGQVEVNRGGTYRDGLRFSHDGRLLAFGCERCLVYNVPKLDVHTGWQQDEVSALAFNPAGDLVAVAYVRGDVELRDLNSSRIVADLRHPRRGWGEESIQFCGAGTRLLSAKKRSIRIWDLTAAKERLAIRGHSEGVAGLAFSPDGQWIASASKDDTVRIWEARSGKLVCQPLACAGDVQSVAFHPTEPILVTGNLVDSPQSLKVWDTRSWDVAATVPHQLGPVGGAIFSRDGLELAACGRDGGVARWALDISTKPDGRAVVVHTLRAHYHDEECLYLAYGPPGKSLAWVHGWQHIRSVRLSERAGPVPLAGAKMYLGWHGIAYSAARESLCFVGQDGRLELWDLHRSRRIEQLGEPGQFRASVVAASPDGRYLAAVSEPQILTIWDLDLKREFVTFRPEVTEIWSAAWSPQGERLAAGLADGTMVVWDVRLIQRQLAAAGLD